MAPRRCGGPPEKPLSRNLVTALLLAAACAAPLAAADVPPDATALLQQMKQAAGGAAWDTVSSLSASGGDSASGLDGKFNSVERPGSGQFERRADFGLFNEADGVDATGCWHQDISRQVHACDSDEALQVAASESYLAGRGYLFPTRVPARFRRLAAVSENGQRYDRLEITPRQGRLLTLWLDGSTHLPRRAVMQLSTTLQSIDYADYREVSGLVLPFGIVTGDGNAANDDRVKLDSWRVDTAPQAPLARPSNAVTDARISGGGASASTRLWLAGGRLLVEATINGQGPFPFILDTGGHAILTPEAAAQLGLKAQGKGVSYGSGEGSTGIQYTRVDKLGIGAVELDDQPFLVLPLGYSTVERGKEPPIAGLIGLELFERFAARLDYDAQQLTLWPLDGFSYHGSGTVVPLRFTEDMPLVQAALDGHRGIFGIDTGNSGDLLLFGPWARSSGLVARYQAGLPLVSYGAGGASTNYAARARSFELGSLPPQRPVARLALDRAGAFSSRSEAGNIGQSVLSRYNITFDYRRQQMILEPRANPPPRDFPRGGFGATKNAAEHFTVNAVISGGPAAAAGMQVGDRILAVDGIGADAIGGDELGDKLRQPPGTPLRLSVQHGEERREINLTLKEMLP